MKDEPSDLKGQMFKFEQLDWRRCRSGRAAEFLGLRGHAADGQGAAEVPEGHGPAAVRVVQKMSFGFCMRSLWYIKNHEKS